MQMLVTDSAAWLDFDANRRTVKCYILYDPLKWVYDKKRVVLNVDLFI